MRYVYICFLILVFSCAEEKNIKSSSNIITKSIIDTEKVHNDDSTINIQPKNNLKKESVKVNKEISIISNINSNETLSSILKQYKVSNKQILLIAEQNILDFNFNNLQVSKQYEVILNKDSSISKFIYYKNAENYYGVLFANPLSYFDNKNTNLDISPTETNDMQKNQNDKIKQKDFLMGRFNPKTHPDFVKVDKEYHTKSEMYLLKETLEAFIKMRESAKLDGISLTIVSGTRNFDAQKRIWEKKYERNKNKGLSDIENIKKIMVWSSMPSTSRHHWGTDIDINGFDEYFDGKNPKANKEYEWLKENASKFGFCQTYTEKKEGGRLTGYNEEKWHWSYMPIAKQLLEDYSKLIDYTDIKGFSASEFSQELNIIEKYVFGIECEF
tara:strand:+ start:190 stop:1344 length:1155 start_codon:yes stop_codon:yes gene_type:complete